MDKKREYAELEPETVSFPSRLKEVIGHNSVRSFSLKVDLSETAVRKYLNGAIPSIDKALKISKVFNIELEWLIAGRGNKEVCIVDSFSGDEHSESHTRNITVSQPLLRTVVRLTDTCEKKLPALLTSDQRTRIIASVYCHAETTNLKPEELTEELVKMAIDVVRD